MHKRILGGTIKLGLTPWCQLIGLTPLKIFRVYGERIKEQSNKNDLEFDSFIQY